MHKAPSFCAQALSKDPPKSKILGYVPLFGGGRVIVESEKRFCPSHKQILQNLVIFQSRKSV